MAVVAGIITGNVCLVLARSIRAVMAARTITRYVDVIEIRGQPTDG